MKSLTHRPSLSRRALNALIPFTLAQSALGVVTVHLVEEGPDLRVSFSGTLALANIGSILGPSPGGLAFIADYGVVNQAGTFYQPSTAGAVSLLPFSEIGVDRPTDRGRVGGFFNSKVIFEPGHVSGGSLSAPTELTFDPLLDYFVLPGNSLSSVNAEPGDIAEGATMWTADSTGDTFVFSRTTPIPEPSSALLVCLSALGFIRRRR